MQARIRPPAGTKALCKRPATIPFSGGLWFDPADNLFKYWYRAGWSRTTEAYATSLDGLHWHRSELDVVPGTNQVLQPDWGRRDSTPQWIDHDVPDPLQRYKMCSWSLESHACVLPSGDGIYWSEPRRRSRPTTAARCSTIRSVTAGVAHSGPPTTTPA